MTDLREMPASETRRQRLPMLMTIALLSVVVLGSVRFGRIDLVDVLTRTSDPAAFVTSSGRTIDRTVVDERQYLSMVALDRGATREAIGEEVLYSPWIDRPGVPWLASRVPLDDEGFSIGLVNLAFSLIGVAAVVLALGRSRASDTAVWIVALAVAVNWNVLMFAGGVLIDPAVFMFMAVGWLLLVSRREWWVVPLMLTAYPLKDTTLMFGAVLVAWVWRHYADRRIEGALLVGSAAVAGLAGLWLTRANVDAEGAWDMGIKFEVLVENQHVLNLAPMALAILPLGLPAFWRILPRKRIDGWVATLMSPDVVGFTMFVAVTLYTWIGHGLSPRLFFVGMPFAAWLAAERFGTAPARKWITRIRALPFAERIIPSPR